MVLRPESLARYRAISARLSRSAGWRRGQDQRHAYAGCYLQALAIQRHRLGQQFAQGIGQPADFLFDQLAAAFQAAEQYHELIATQARHGVFQAHTGFQPRCDDLQHRVAHRVAQRVVDVLEVVEVEEQQGAAKVVAPEQGDLLAQAVHQQGAVGQVGQRVVVGQVANLCLGVFSWLTSRAVTSRQSTSLRVIGSTDTSTVRMSPRLLRPSISR